MIATQVIKKLLDEASNGECLVAYVYFEYKEKDKLDEHAVLASVLQQLVHWKRSIPKPVDDLYKRCQEQKTLHTCQEIRDTLLALVTDSINMYAVLDGLDECRDDALGEVLSCLRKMSSMGRLSLMVTSRPVPEITNLFSDDEILSVRASEEDLNLYIHTRASKMKYKPFKEHSDQSSTAGKVCQEVQGLSDGV